MTPTSTPSGGAATRCRTLQVHTLLDGVRGKGQYVGTYLAWGVRNRLVGRGRGQVLPGRRRRVPDHLRDRHGGLLRRRVELRAPARRVRRVQHGVPGPSASDHARRPVPEPAALRHVPLARQGHDPL